MVDRFEAAATACLAAALAVKNAAKLKSCCLVRHAPRLEHLGFVAVAAKDAFGFHTVTTMVGVWLFVTGVIVELIGREA